MQRYITLSELRRKLSGRSRNSIFRDIERGNLPRPFRLGIVNYWVEQDVDNALKAQASKASSCTKD